jgi:hypothetical protein
MKTTFPPFVAALILLAAPLAAQETKRAAAPSEKPANKDVRRGEKWGQTIEDRSQRGTLHDEFQHVRGDSGKWSDEPQFLHAAAASRKLASLKLDDWADRLFEAEPAAIAAEGDQWLLVRTRQLDDNDRLWIERVERQGNQFTIVLSEAIWQGRYQKTFTYYGVFGVNLGQLPPGEYQAKCIIQPVSFKQFTGDGRPLPENWPKDDRPAEKKPAELRATFRVGE